MNEIYQITDLSSPPGVTKKRRNIQITEFSDRNNLSLNKRLVDLCVNVKPSFQKMLLDLSDEDKELICDFVDDWSIRGNGAKMAPATKKMYIDTLVSLSRYVKIKLNSGKYRPFRDITRDDFLRAWPHPKGYPENHRKEYKDDPDEKWVNTYRTRASKCLAFWKYLTQPDSFSVAYTNCLLFVRISIILVAADSAHPDAAVFSLLSIV